MEEGAYQPHVNTQSWRHNFARINPFFAYQHPTTLNVDSPNFGILNGSNVSIVTIGERQLQSNENSRVRKKVSCPIADIGELTQSTLCGH